MYNPNTHKFCSEFYTIEKSIEVVVTIKGEDERIRIDALRDETTGKFCTISYIQEHFTLQQTYPQDNGVSCRSPEDYRVWVSYDLPWTDGDTADKVLNRALSFLEERCSK